MLSASESKAGETLSTGSATATVTQIKSTKTNMFGVMVHVDEWCLQRARHHFFCVDMRIARAPGQYLEGRAACIVADAETSAATLGWREQHHRQQTTVLLWWL
jgi:hypothetical protein